MAGNDSWLPLPLTGRQDELTAIRGALDAAANGQAGAVVIAGTYGVGKTRLLHAILGEAAERDFTVAHGTASRTDADMPYSVFMDAFTPVVRGLNAKQLADLAQGTTADLARVVPVFDRSPSSASRVSAAPDAPDDVPTRARWHFTQFLDRFSEQRPVLLAIDNVQWADPSSVGLIQFILRHAPSARVLVLATYNPDEAAGSPPLREVQKDPATRDHVRELTLSALERPDVVGLLAAAFEVPESAVTDFGATLFQRTLGNPFFIEEMLKSLVERDALRQVNGDWVGWTTDAFEIPATVREVVLSRVNALPAAERELLDTLSAFTTRVVDDVLMDAAELDRPAFERAAEVLRTRHLLSAIETPEGILCDIPHPLTRKTVYDETSAVRKRALHGRIAAAMEGHYGADSESHATELSYHCVRAGPAVSAKAWRYLVAAGRDALERHADSEAAAYLQRAVELSEKRGEVPTPLLEELARARQRLSEYDAARALWIRAREALLAAGDHAGLARVERRLGMLPVLHAEMDQALVHFTLALSHARTAGRRDIEVSTLVSISLALANLGRVAEAKARAEEALAIVEASGDVVQRARVERALLELTTYTGPVNIAVEYSRRAVEHAIASGDRGLMWSAHWASAVLAGVTANAEEVVEQSRAAAAIARELNSPSLSAYVDEVAIEYAIAKGDWGEALRIAERAVPVARAVAPRTLAARLLVWMGTVLLYRDDVAAATAAFDEAWELSRADLPEGRGGEVHTVIVAHIGQASLYFATRDWRRALDYAQRGIELGDQHGLVAWSVHRLLPILAEGALYKNDLALAESAARRLGRDAATMGHRLGLWYAESVALYLEYLRAPSMAVLPSLLAIADAAEGVPYVFPAARLRRDVARLLVAQGDREGASREFRRAHEVFDRLGAQFELRWTREHMRQAGMRPPQLVNGARKVLSPRELEVALLVSRGRTNKEIGADLGIAWPTVQRHVSTAFRKLGVDSRMGLADAVRGMEGR